MNRPSERESMSLTPPKVNSEKTIEELKFLKSWYEGRMKQIDESISALLKATSRENGAVATTHPDVLPIAPELVGAPKPPDPPAPKPQRPPRKAGKNAAGQNRGPDLRFSTAGPVASKAASAKARSDAQATQDALAARDAIAAEQALPPQPVRETRPRSRGEAVPINGNRIQAAALPTNQYAVTVFDEMPTARSKAHRPSGIDDGSGTSDSDWGRAKSGPRTAPMTAMGKVMDTRTMQVARDGCNPEEADMHAEEH